MLRRSALLLSVLLLAAGCGGTAAGVADRTDGGGSAGEQPSVVVTTSILGDVVRTLVQGDAEVEVLMPPGSDPHSFSPSAAQADAMRQADLLVVNGAGAEEGMLDVIQAAEDDGTPTFEAISAVDTIGFGDEHGHAEDEGHSEDESHSEEETDDDHTGGADPHFWQDPSRMASVVTALADRLAEVESSVDAEEWTARGEALAEQMVELDAEVEEILSEVPEDRRLLVTNHEAFGYFADRYGFEILGTVIPGGGTLAEPSASALEDLTHTIGESGVTAVFAESSNPSALAEAVAAEVGADVEIVPLFSDSLSEDGEGGATYEEFMRSNATAIAGALT